VTRDKKERRHNQEKSGLEISKAAAASVLRLSF